MDSWADPRLPAGWTPQDAHQLEMAVTDEIVRQLLELLRDPAHMCRLLLAALERQP
jgi:hypothetical protein